VAGFQTELPNIDSEHQRATATGLACVVPLADKPRAALLEKSMIKGEGYRRASRIAAGNDQSAAAILSISKLLIRVSSGVALCQATYSKPPSPTMSFSTISRSVKPQHFGNV